MIIKIHMAKGIVKLFFDEGNTGLWTYILEISMKRKIMKYKFFCVVFMPTLLPFLIPYAVTAKQEMVALTSRHDLMAGGSNITLSYFLFSVPKERRAGQANRPSSFQEGRPQFVFRF